MVDGGGLFSDRFDVGRDLVSLVLTANNLPRLDFIAVTHPDRDHLKGLLFIAANYAMKAAYTAPLEGIDTPQHGSPRPLSEAFTAILASRGIPRHTLGAGNVLPLADGLALEVLAPAPGVTPSGNDGLVFRLVLNGHGLALLPGDAEAPYLRACSSCLTTVPQAALSRLCTTRCLQSWPSPAPERTTRTGFPPGKSATHWNGGIFRFTSPVMKAKSPSIGT